MKKFTAILLAVVMVFALGASAFAADTTPVTTKAVDTTLSVTVDYTIEGLYFDGTTLKSSARRATAASALPQTPAATSRSRSR